MEYRRHRIRHELGRGYFHSTLHPRRVFDKIDLYGGSGEQSTGEDSNELSYLTHRLLPQEQAGGDSSQQQEPCGGEAHCTDSNADGRSAKPVEQAENKIDAADDG